ncbi:hypothetical protein FRC11_008376 [Ceratobasidium sp. 423]|nr:hypothetical protein FRC11_008376 [Ceratobasidium sp. 423]
MIGGVQHTLYIDNEWLGKFLRFYGVGEQYFEAETSTKLRDDCADGARGDANTVLTHHGWDVPIVAYTPITAP